jgi:hypothetical protein
MELGVLAGQLQPLGVIEFIHLHLVVILQFLNNMKYLILALLFCSCSPKRDNNILPRYSDMSAAEEAGRAKSQ